MDHTYINHVLTNLIRRPSLTVSFAAMKKKSTGKATVFSMAAKKSC